MIAIFDQTIGDLDNGRKAKRRIHRGYFLHTGEPGEVAFKGNANSEVKISDACQGGCAGSLSGENACASSSTARTRSAKEETLPVPHWMRHCMRNLGVTAFQLSSSLHYSWFSMARVCAALED